MVPLQSQTSLGSPGKSNSTELKKHGSVDLTILLRWVNRLDEIVEACSRAQGGASDGPTETELALVVAERDLVKDECTSLQKIVAKVRFFLGSGHDL